MIGFERSPLTNKEKVQLILDEHSALWESIRSRVAAIDDLSSSEYAGVLLQCRQATVVASAVLTGRLSDETRDQIAGMLPDVGEDVRFNVKQRSESSLFANA